MRAHEKDVTVEEDGLIAVDNLPVKVGDRVKVIVLVPDQPRSTNGLYPLRGREPYNFVDATSPVAPEDWESAK
jgi:hypothetical protein